MAEIHGRGQYLPDLPEKAEQTYGIREKSEKPTQNSSDNLSSRKMPSARSFVFALLVLFSVAFGLGSATVPTPKRQPAEDDQSSSGEEQAILDPEVSTFTKLLSSASPDALHQLLHTYFPKTFRHGIYPSDESAVEAVRSSDADLANVLLSLARRQDNGSSTSAAISSSTTAVQSITITTTTTVPSSPTSTTTQQQSSTQVSTSTTSAPGGTTIVQSPTNPAVTTTTSLLDTTTKVQTTSVANPGTNGATTNHGTTLSTATSSGKSESSTAESLFTSSHTSTFISTLPGGAKTTITSVEIVTGGIPAPGSATSQVTGSLQTGAALLNYRTPMVEAVVGLAIGGALLA